MSEVSSVLVLALVAVFAVILALAGFGLGWWLRDRVADRIDDEREAVAAQTAQRVMVNVLRPGPN